MIEKISRLDQTVNDASIIVKHCAQDILATIDDVKDLGYMDIDGLKKMLENANCINGWVNKLAMLFLKTKEESK